VILGERGIHDPPVALIEHDLLHEREAKAHDDAAAELTRRRLGVEDAAAIERAKETADAQFARHGVLPDLAEQSAVAVHGPMSELKRHRRLRLDRHLLTPSTAQDRGIVLMSGLVVEGGQPTFETARLIGLSPAKGESLPASFKSSFTSAR
jgi:hypothetical protein